MWCSLRLADQCGPVQAATKPREVVRQYDSLLGCTRELRAAAAALGGSAGELLLDLCAAAVRAPPMYAGRAQRACVQLLHGVAALAFPCAPAGTQAPQGVRRAPVQAAQYRAHRCFYVAQAHREAGDPQAASGLLSRAQQRADEAVSAHQECAHVDQAAVQALRQLQEQAGAWQCVAQVRAGSRLRVPARSPPLASKHRGAAQLAPGLREPAAAEGWRLACRQRRLQQRRLPQMQLARGSRTCQCQARGTPMHQVRRWHFRHCCTATDWAQADPRAAAEFLLDNLQSWQDFTQPPRLFAIPPTPSLVAMRPFLLDTAQKFVAPPSLEHRTAARQKPGMVASLFGWKK